MNIVFFFTIFRAVRLKYTIPGHPILCWNSKPVIWVLSWDSSAVITLHRAFCACVRMHITLPSTFTFVCQEYKIPVWWIYWRVWLPPSPQLPVGADTLIYPTYHSQDNHLTLVTGVSLISHLVSVTWLLTGPGTTLHIVFHIWLQRDLSLGFLWPACKPDI